MEKKIDEFDGDYSVTDGGIVYSYKYGRKRKMSQHINSYGYPKVHLRKDGKTVVRVVHRLVADAFIPNPENKLEVNHLNGIKTDNNIRNLEWCTSAENMRHAYKTGLKNTAGVNNGQSKYTEEQIIHLLKLLKAGHSFPEIEKITGIRAKYARMIARGEYWSHLSV